MEIDSRHDIWVEKYRPQKIDDTILTSEMRGKFKEFVNKPYNMLLCSRNPGTGKTSLVNSIIKDGGFETLFLNASLENGIDTLRGKIKNFASTQSFNDKPKIVLLDECDNYTNDAQAALRGMIEEFSLNCRFILTCNYLSKIIEPIVNRMCVFDFDDVYQKNMSELVPKIYERLIFILNNENISFEQNDVANIIKNSYPSIRGMISNIQTNIIDGKLIVNYQTDANFDNIIAYCASNNYQSMVDEIENLNNPAAFYEYYHKKLSNDLNINKNFGNIIIILAKYQSMDATVRDKHLNLTACLFELKPFL